MLSSDTFLTKQWTYILLMKLNCPLILASASPRRKALLQQLGLEFSVQKSNADESFNPMAPPETIVQELAQKKADIIASGFPRSLTLAADTIVVLDHKILGKPTDREDAIRMLTSLSNRQHVVYTGIALSHPQSHRKVTGYESTKVNFAPLTPAEIESYVSTGSPMDKAGSYGIQDDQGALYVSGIVGDYYNVVGLPIHLMYTILKKNFDDLLTY